MNWDETKIECAVCHKVKVCTHEPSRKQLFFGGFNVKMEYRCKVCERALAEKIGRIIDRIGKE